MEELWKDLPPDILERVATFLPLACVIRFTCVSKTWNSLIHTREFALRHACASPPERYALVTTRYDAWETPNPTRHWEVLNTARTAFFALRNDFVTDYVLREGIVKSTASNSRADWSERAVLAADGGLVCVTYFSTFRNSALLVCNPVLRSVRRLPELETWGRDDQRVVMATDRRSMEYQVFVINNIFHPHHPNVVYIYESKTGAWRELSLSSLLLDPTQAARFETETESFVELEALSTSCIRNKIYKLFVHRDISLSAFISFHTVTGVVSEVTRPDIIGAAYYVQLVEAQGRLFYIALVGGAQVQVFEVREEECDSVTEMPDELLKWVLGNMCVSFALDPIDGPGTLFAVGCGGDALLFCSVLGRSVAYDLSRNAWDYYPDNGLAEARRYYNADEYYEICGSNYCLSLCPP